MSDIKTIDDVANLRSLAAAVTANPGSIAIQNVNNALKQVDDQGTVTSLGGGGGAGTVTSVAATAGGLLAVAGTPTVAPTVGLAAAAAHTLIGNGTAGSAVPTALSAAAAQAMLGTGDAWYDAQVALINGIGNAAGVTFRLEYEKYPKSLAMPAPGVAVSTVNGGGIGVAHATNYLLFTNSQIVATGKTDPWVVLYRAKFPVVTVGASSTIGVNVDITTPQAYIGWNQAVSATKFIAALGNGVVTSTINADLAWHNVAIVFDGVTVTATFDSVTIGTSAVLGGMSNSPLYPSSYTTAALTPGVIVSRLIYGYVDPTT